jgi:hypothetical protein
MPIDVIITHMQATVASKKTSEPQAQGEMTMTTWTVPQLINLSVSRNESVAEFPATKAEFDELYNSLLTECSDDCDPICVSGQGYGGDEARGLVRFWGVTEEGDNWTVEIVNPPAEYGSNVSDEQVEVCSTPIQYDKSGVGHCWVAATEADCPASIQEEIAGEIIDGKMDNCDDYVASNGIHYRW